MTMKTFEQLSIKTHSNYWLSHSVGLPFKGSKAHFEHAYFDVWQQQTEPWPQWLAAVEHFRQQLALLLHANIDELCPQTNLSSALTKVIFSLPKPDKNKNVILYSQADFPSMAFVLEQAKTLGYQLKSLPVEANLHDLSHWKNAIDEHTALVFISHVQSNNGQRLPVKNIIDLAKAQQALSIVDVAQSIAIFPIDVNDWQADFILGSSVKWLCGGSGAGFLWVNSKQLEMCEPVDVGWFSHQNPFEFDGTHFQYHHSALRFWGGTPSVAPFVIAGFAIEQINHLGVKTIHGINQAHQQTIRANINPKLIVSPHLLEHSSGTLILHFKHQHQQVIERLNRANISFDSREPGIRLSPHFYTTIDEVNLLLNVLNNQ